MTKKQRNKIYCDMLENLLSHSCYKHFGFYWSGLCGLLKHMNIKDFPELIKHKPKGKSNDVYWFETKNKGTDTRICILLTAIMETL